MPQLVGLEGVRKKALDAQFFQKPSQASRLLRTNRALTAASDNGAINVWIDDTGCYRASFYRHYLCLSEWRGEKKTKLTMWLKEWMPQMEFQAGMSEEGQR
jgi:hypothetical protein